MRTAATATLISTLAIAGGPCPGPQICFRFLATGETSPSCKYHGEVLQHLCLMTLTTLLPPSYELLAACPHFGVHFCFSGDASCPTELQDVIENYCADLAQLAAIAPPTPASESTGDDYTYSTDLESSETSDYTYSTDWESTDTSFADSTTEQEDSIPQVTTTEPATEPITAAISTYPWTTPSRWRKRPYEWFDETALLLLFGGTIFALTLVILISWMFKTIPSTQPPPPPSGRRIQVIRVPVVRVPVMATAPLAPQLVTPTRSPPHRTASTAVAERPSSQYQRNERDEMEEIDLEMFQ